MTRQNLNRHYVCAECGMRGDSGYPRAERQPAVNRGEALIAGSPQVCFLSNVGNVLFKLFTSFYIFTDFTNWISGNHFMNKMKKSIISIESSFITGCYSTVANMFRNVMKYFNL